MHLALFDNSFKQDPMTIRWKERSFDNLCKIEGKLTFSRVNKGPLSLWTFGYVNLV